jgi:hypothetical protein
MARAWAALVAPPQSLSLQAVALVTPVGVVAAPLAASPSAATPAEALRWMLIGLLAQIPMGMVMLVAGQAVGRVPWPRAFTLAAILIAGAARGLVIAIIGQAPDAVTRTVSSAVTMSVWLLVIGAALNSHDRHRREIDELLAALVARELQGRLLDEAVTTAARADTAVRVAETSQGLRTIVTGAADDHERTAALLQAAIETRLRPLSHELWFRPRPVPPQAHRRADVVVRILTADVPVLPLLVSSLILLAWGSIVLHGAGRAALVGVAVALGYGAVLAGAHALRARPVVASVVRYGGSCVLPALAGEAAIGVLGLGDQLSPLAVALGLPLITLGVATATTLGADRSRTIADLRARLAEPEWDRHLGDLVRVEVDASTATMLHNSVQPVLTAAALQLQLAAALEDPRRARDALDRALRALDEVESGSVRTSTGRRRLADAPDAWRGLADVHLEVPKVEADDAEWELLADVVHESIANAVRHGRATVIVIGIDMRSTDIVVTMNDNRSVDDGAGTPGLGTTWLSSVTESAVVGIEPDGRRRSRLVIPRAGCV